MSVTITKPAPGAVLTGTVTVTATFVGTRFDVATVTIDGQQLGMDSVQPISIAIDTKRVPDGAHTLTVAVRQGKPKRWQKASMPITVAVVAPPPVATKPSIPTGLSAAPGDGKVSLSWGANPASEAVDGYQVYVDGTMVADHVSAPSYTVTGVVNGQAYAFRVSAHNAQDYGDWTNPVSATPVGPSPPSAGNVAVSAPSAVVTA